ncbi:MAG TPA: glutamyl-tRNA reductase [Thermoanaerobaculia bacterium]|nr:glutamyl-tRNA reductase [Thermoanaerobaculia bacterium]
MSLLLVGINHRTAPVDVRERLSVSDARLPEMLAELKSLSGIDGAAIVSTCNRVETVVSTENEDVIESIVNWLTIRGSATRAELEKHLYILRHGDVVRHLFRVAAGLDSMIVGEPQIGGQVRTSFQTSQRLGTLDPLLNQLFEQTMRVAKRVRSETGIGEHAVSVPYAAVELAKKIFGDLSGLRVMLLGAGEIAELTAEHFAAHDVAQMFVANRAIDRAHDLASRFNGVATKFDEFPSHLAQCDIVVASTGAPHYLILADDVERALAARKRRNLFLIDLSVPRNIEPAVAKVSGAYLYNIDDLQTVAESNRQLREGKAVDAEELVAREVETFKKRLVAQDAVPTILELQQRLETIRAAELEKCLRKLGPVSADQRAAIDQLTTQIVNKILHYPILQLKEADDEPQERESLRRTIRKIFGLR